MSDKGQGEGGTSGTGPSGGGYGNPELRKRAAIDQDIADGLISLKTAKKLFPNQF